MSGIFKVGANGAAELKEQDGIDYAPTTVQLPGGERVPFLFTIKQFDGKGTLDNIAGDFVVPSYRGATFLDPKVRAARRLKGHKPPGGACKHTPALWLRATGLAVANGNNKSRVIHSLHCWSMGVPSQLALLTDLIGTARHSHQLAHMHFSLHRESGCVLSAASGTLPCATVHAATQRSLVGQALHG